MSSSRVRTRFKHHFCGTRLKSSVRNTGRFSARSRKYQSDTSTTFRGLGHVDSNKDTITIQFEPKAKDEGSRSPNVGTSLSNTKPAKRVKHRTPQPSWSFEVELAQDRTALRSRKGDTGSVLWKARCALRIKPPFRACRLSILRP